MKKSLFTLLLFVVGALTLQAGEPLRILAIGNSFSVDALEQDICKIAAANGIDLTVGNLYHPGCPVERHYRNITGNIGDYRYRKETTAGAVDTINDATIALALADEPWDIITFQQASHDSGLYATYARLPELIAAVRKQAGDRPRFYWHETWAYSPDSDHGGFANYGRDQRVMYDSITTVATRILAENPSLTGIIPTGTAIQNARTTALGDNLTRDGFHLSYDEGRYIAALTWLAALTGREIDPDAFTPARLNSAQRREAMRAVKAAIANPLRLTPLD